MKEIQIGKAYGFELHIKYLFLSLNFTKKKNIYIYIVSFSIFFQFNFDKKKNYFCYFLVSRLRKKRERDR
jgi:hypothetical protein